jgi:maleate isomerase
MEKFDYSYSRQRDEFKTLGLIVLKSDETLELEFRSLIPDMQCVVHHTRIESDAVVTTETLRQMEARIPAAAALLPDRVRFDVVAYACTSGATTIGPKNVAAAIRSVHPETSVTDPLTAIISRLKDYDVHNIGLLTPYVPEVTAAMSHELHKAGFNIAVAGSFYEAEEHKVVRIDQDSVLAAIEKLAASGACEAIFVSCTNLPTLQILAEAEKRTGIPVISSNSALAWHMLKLAENS